MPAAPPQRRLTALLSAGRSGDQVGRAANTSRGGSSPAPVLAAAAGTAVPGCGGAGRGHGGRRGWGHFPESPVGAALSHARFPAPRGRLTQAGIPCAAAEASPGPALAPAPAPAPAPALAPAPARGRARAGPGRRVCSPGRSPATAQPEGEQRGAGPGSSYKMENKLFLCVLVSCWHFLNALFRVEVPQTLYIVDYGNNVTMECRFPVNDHLELKDLSIIWEKQEQNTKEVYKLHKGNEDFTTQHSDFSGRIKLFQEKLKLGQSLLQISNVMFTDAGNYLCLIGYRGADYKKITLKVRAPYRNITTRTVPIQSSRVHKEKVLTCKSEGYPKAEVIWQNGDYHDLSNKANTSYETGTNQLYHVTSTLTIDIRINETFRCIFWNKQLQENTSAVFIISGYDEDNSRHHGLIGVAAFFLVLLLLCLFGIKKAREYKYSRTCTKNSLPDVTDVRIEET